MSWVGTFTFSSTYYIVDEVSNIRFGFNYWFKYYVIELRLLNSYLTSNSEITKVGRWIRYCLDGLKPLYVLVHKNIVHNVFKKSLYWFGQWNRENAKNLEAIIK